MRRSGFKAKLRAMLREAELEDFKSALEVIGDIAIVKLSGRLQDRGHELAEAILKMTPQVKTVMEQASPVSEEFRVRELRWLGGERKTVTVHRESGCRFLVDVAKAYFSPRLQFERRRVASLVGAGEVVVNLFAGVGTFSIVIAKHARPAKVYSIDLNAEAYRLMVENVKLNRVEGVVEPILGHAKKVVEGRLAASADRVLMPLPEKAYDYLDTALEALKPGVGRIHYYDFVHAARGEEPLAKVAGRVSKKLSGLGVSFTVEGSRVVRSVGPNWKQVVLDLLVERGRR